MFIGGLTMSATKDKLERYYGQWGMIIDAAVVTDPQTRRSRGYINYWVNYARYTPLGNHTLSLAQMGLRIGLKVLGLLERM